MALQSRSRVCSQIGGLGRARHGSPLCRDGTPGGRQSKREGLAAPAAGQGAAAGDEIRSFPSLSNEPFPRTCLCVLVSGRYRTLSGELHEQAGLGRPWSPGEQGLRPAAPT